MAISTAQYIDLLFKKLQGVAKTATATQKSASNESIASPALLRGDIIWTQADQIPGTAQVVANVTQGYLTTSRIECTADNTVPTIGGIYPTWLTNLQYWIPQEFGSTWPVKVYVDTAGAANPTVTGTQIFAPGISGVGEFFFDTQAGVLNFIGETIPSTLTAGKSIFITGYRYVGQLGVTNLPSANIGNIQITGNTIVTLNTNGDLVLDPNGSGSVRILANTSVTGNITSSGFISVTGNVTGNYILGNGSFLTGVVASSANAGDLTGNTLSSNVFYSNLTQVGNLTSLSVVGNTSSGNISVTGFVSATGNVYGNGIFSDNYYYANGQPIPSGIVYTAATAPPASSIIGDQWYDTTNDVLYEYITDGTSDYWVDTTSPAFAAGVVANVVISGNMIPVANITYDIGTSGSYFRTAFLNTVSVSGNVVANGIRSDVITTNILANTTAINLQTAGTNALSIDSNQNITTYKRLAASSMPLGAAVQTVMSNTSGGSSTTATSYTDVTSATVNITPGSSTSKVLVIVSGTSEFTAVVSGNVTGSTRLVRNSTVLQQQSYGTGFAFGGIAQSSPMGFSYLDSPGTTSPLTYKLQQKTSNSSSTLTSSEIWIVAMEIAAV
jgi:hypothetical protein